LNRVILLTQKEFAPAVTQALEIHADVMLATTLAELETALSHGHARVISFGSGVIVPAALLQRLSGPAYNFHPGPPSYPGIYPSVFALYDNAAHFGVTLHEMAPQVDSGAIVAFEQFGIPKQWDRLALDQATYTAMLNLLSKSAKALADIFRPLAPLSEQRWSGTRRRQKDFDALCQLPDDVSPDEFIRRYRAVGEGPDHALRFTRFGRTFCLAPRGGEVVRGGQPIQS